MIFLLLILTGCSKKSEIYGDLHIWIYANGSGKYELTMRTHPLLLPNLQFLKERLQASQFKIQTFENKSSAGWIATKQVKNIRDEPIPFEESVATTHTTEKWKKSIQIKRGIFFQTISMDYDLNLTKIDQEVPLKEFAKLFYDRVKIKLFLTLPIRPTKHNAVVESDEGKTLQWNPQLGKHNRIQLSGDIPNLVGWFSTGFLSLCLLGGIGYWFWRKQRR